MDTKHKFQYILVLDKPIIIDTMPVKYLGPFVTIHSAQVVYDVLNASSVLENNGASVDVIRIPD